MRESRTCSKRHKMRHYIMALVGLTGLTSETSAANDTSRSAAITSSPSSADGYPACATQTSITCCTATEAGACWSTPFGLPTRFTVQPGPAAPSLAGCWNYEERDLTSFEPEKPLSTTSTASSSTPTSSTVTSPASLSNPSPTRSSSHVSASQSPENSTAIISKNSSDADESSTAPTNIPSSSSQSSSAAHSVLPALPSWNHTYMRTRLSTSTTTIAGSVSTDVLHVVQIASEPFTAASDGPAPTSAQHTATDTTKASAPTDDSNCPASGLDVPTASQAEDTSPANESEQNHATSSSSTFSIYTPTGSHGDRSRSMRRATNTTPAPT
jgi:hypothetical protein